jgi:hypothetical protein
MLKQAVGIVASIVAAAVVALSIAVLVRISWGQPNTPSPSQASRKDL